MIPEHPFLVAVAAIGARYPYARLAIVRPPFGADTDAFVIHDIAIPSDRRGRGLGTLLLGEIVEAADRHGANLHVEPALTRDGVLDLGVSEWYARAGFAWNDPVDPLADGQMHRRAPFSAAPALR